MIQEYKKEAVKVATANLKDSKAIILIDYKGIDAGEVEELRNRFREAGVKYFVAKNTFLKIALNDLGITKLDEYLVGPVAVATSSLDEVSAARELMRFKNEITTGKEYPSFKIGLVNDDIMDPANLSELAKLPSKEVLLAQVLQGFNAPMVGLVGVLQGVIRKFVYTVDAIKDKKEENN